MIFHEPVHYNFYLKSMGYYLVHTMVKLITETFSLFHIRLSHTPYATNVLKM